MEHARVYYLETSFWGMLLPDQPTELRRDSSRLLERLRLRRSICLISPVVLEGVAAAPARQASRMARFMAGLATQAVRIEEPHRELARAYVAAGIVPFKKLNDALHVAAATIGEADVLVSWNYRHLVSPRRAEAFCAVNLLRGYNPALEISTPAEVLHGEASND